MVAAVCSNSTEWSGHTTRLADAKAQVEIIMIVLQLAADPELALTDGRRPRLAVSLTTLCRGTLRKQACATNQRLSATARARDCAAM